MGATATHDEEICDQIGRRVNAPIWTQAEAKLQELIQSGNIEAIRLGLEMRPKATTY